MERVLVRNQDLSFKVSCVQLPQPSLSSILDVLNILNGIIIISVGSMSNAATAETTETPAESKPTTESLGMTDEALD